MDFSKNATKTRVNKMALSLASLKKVHADKPPRILVYGPAGIGKTTLASEFPSPVFLQIEDGTPAGVELTSFGKIDTFQQLIEALGALYTEEHDYKTVVVDSVTELQKLVFAETCARGDDKGNPKTNIEDFGYGKGYVYALRVWQEFLDGINALRADKNMTIVLIAHSTIERFDDPETVSYDRYEIDLHGKSCGLLEREMDAIFLLKQPVAIKQENIGFSNTRAVASGNSNVIEINTTGRPAFTAKNRYNMPASIRYIKGQGYTELAKYFPNNENKTETNKEPQK